MTANTPSPEQIAKAILWQDHEKEPVPIYDMIVDAISAERQRLEAALEDIASDCKWYWDYLDDLDMKHAHQCVRDIENTAKNWLTTSKRVLGGNNKEEK